MSGILDIVLVDDESPAREAIEKTLEAYDIQVASFVDGSDLIEVVKSDVNDQFQAALVDWMLYKVDAQGNLTRQEQPLQGRAVCKQLKELKSYLPVFAITQVGDPCRPDRLQDSRTIAETMGKYPFDDYFPKALLDNSDEVRRFVDTIRAAVQNSREVLSSLPSTAPWLRNCQPLYLKARFDRDWPETEARIQERAEECAQYILENGLPDHRFKNLNDWLQTQEKGNVLLENILIARRVVFAIIAACAGQIDGKNGVRDNIGYYTDDIETETKLERAFLQYISTLGIKPTDYLRSKRGLLIEERRWLEEFCRRKGLNFPF